MINQQQIKRTNKLANDYRKISMESIEHGKQNYYHTLDQNLRALQVAKPISVLTHTITCMCGWEGVKNNQCVNMYIKATVIGG